MLQKFFQNRLVNFIGRTFFYFAIIIALIYLYSYSGVGQGHFIYNEF
ncbi:teichoic acid D-Ala incorporation-associated protein DltX [Leuconostoc fallax]|uniref:D-Ala-teichoic acid biosynthesis protein n=1 Tax=Leuconostoc fallax TaxID=1251 RepID=A0A4R5NA22_9LACO|nr:teichoic acid D-Ala incorporation-associated protein DltX [Leuconostoc fallax]MBU7456260.1 teichoic acid D-Ala incorporation-associated protein DltX [Leuconostoc fallax]MCO6184426.1 teichoic acid D-Ala incorporation-associated protein DltX [Leuconostoc fallax]TDG69085.1 hypothetical protein C5L23_001216 [Leuconostoc fallax]